MAADAARATSALAVSLGPQHADALRDMAAQLQQSIQMEAAKGTASNTAALSAVTDALMARLDALPGDGHGADLKEIVQQIR